MLRDPTYIPKTKFINESKMLQLAFLDKIIEECDDDQNHNRIGDIVQRTQSFVDTQVQKIKNDDLKIELEVKKDEDFEYQLAFDQSFYGKESVNVIKKDQYNIRNKIRTCIGQQAAKGISQNSDVFWISKSRPYSKPFLSRFPQLNASTN